MKSVGLGVTHPHTTCLLPSWEGQVTVALDTVELSHLQLAYLSRDGLSRGDNVPDHV